MDQAMSSQGRKRQHSGEEEAPHSAKRPAIDPLALRTSRREALLLAYSKIASKDRMQSPLNILQNYLTAKKVREEMKEELVGAFSSNRALLRKKWEVYLAVDKRPFVHLARLEEKREHLKVETRVSFDVEKKFISEDEARF